MESMKPWKPPSERVLDCDIALSHGDDRAARDQLLSTKMDAVQRVEDWFIIIPLDQRFERCG